MSHPSILKPQELKLLELLIAVTRQKDFSSGSPTTYVSYISCHKLLDLDKKGISWGTSLNYYGLGSLAKWIKSNRFPAITGLVIDQKTGEPSTGFWDILNQEPSESWLIEQLDQAQTMEWEKLINGLNTATIQGLSAKLDSGLYGKK